MKRPFFTRTVSLVAFVLLAQGAQALTVNIDMPNLTFPEGEVTSSTKTCEARAATPCPAEE
jgi:hypothetical protein